MSSGKPPPKEGLPSRVGRAVRDTLHISRGAGSDGDVKRANNASTKGTRVKRDGNATILSQDAEGNPESLDVTRLTKDEKKEVLQSVLGDGGSLRLLERVHERLQAVDVTPPTILVRYRDLSVTATVIVGTVAVPTLPRSMLEPAAPLLGSKPLRRFGLVHRTERYPILNGIDGIIHPGRLTLLLGPPGGGKSTFLKTLAGYNRREKGVEISSRELTYNGLGFDEFVVERSSAYVGQVENHYGELTVRETFDFAARCQSSGYRRDELEEVIERERERGIHPDPEVDAFMRSHAYARGAGSSLMVELVINLLGLDECADTLVGNAMLRGISGGQKKRVTTGELVVGPARALFLDEISTGLDSNTAFTIVQSLRNLSHVLKATILVGLLQPGPETFELFDDVVLTASAQVPFHGPREDALPFFEALGFVCPARVGVADFLQEIVSPADQVKYWGGNGAYVYHPIGQFKNSWGATEYWKKEMATLDRPFDPSDLGYGEDEGVEGDGSDGKGQRPSRRDKVNLALQQTRYSESRFELVRINVWRWAILDKRMLVFTLLRGLVIIIMGIVVGTTFIRLKRDNILDAQHFMSVIFFSVLYAALPTISDMQVLVPRLPVIFRQRNAHFYPGWSFALAPALLRLPFSFVEATLWTMTCYWLAGFTTSARVIMFWFQLIVFSIWSAGFFSLIAGFTRDDTVSTAVAAFLIMILLNGCGIIIPPPYIHKWWLGSYWANPMAYVIRALAINEFTSSHWNWVNPLVPGSTFGHAVLDSRGYGHQYWWTWVSFAFLFGVWLINLGCFVACMTFLENLYTMPVLSEEQLAEMAHAREEWLGDIQLHEKLGDDPAPWKVEAAEAATVKRSGSATGAPSVSGGSETPTGKGATGIATAKVTFTPPAEPLAEARPDRAEGSEGDPEASSPSLGQASGRSTSLVPRQPSMAAAEDARERVLGSPQSSFRLPFSERSRVSMSAKEHYAKSSSIPFRPLPMTFRDVEYSVPIPPSADRSKANIPTEGPHAGALRLLNHIDGVFRPGVLTALMGASGAGKTTLMDVLADRKTVGTITGDIRVNGYPQVPNTFARVTGYVEQTDIHVPQATVKEALQFSAILRLPKDIDAETREKFVDEILSLAELDLLSNAYVGNPGVDGLSVEQRKRLTIAVELVANPSLVFMDEPTSGLDARAANIVMRAVRNTVDSGRTVVCTIHQPNVDIFQAFDELLLLKPGGRTIFNGTTGDESADLISYFQAISGVVPIRQHYNPANWMLEVTNPRAEATLGVDFADLYLASEQRQDLLRLLEASETPPEGSTDLSMAEMGIHGPMQQFKVLLQRNFRTYWRHPGYNLTRFTLTLAAALFYGSFFYKMGRDYSSATTITTLLGAQYSSTVFLGLLWALTVQHVVDTQRTVFYRERAAGIYGVLPYGLAQQLVEIPYALVIGTMYVIVVYWMVYFIADAGKFFWYWAYFVTTLLYCTFFGSMAMAFSPALPYASIFVAFLFGFWNLYAGFLIAKPQAKGWFIFGLYLSPIYWSIYGLVVSQLGDLDDVYVMDLFGTLRTLPDFLKNSFGYTYVVSQGPLLAVTISVGVAFTILTIIALAKINYQSR